MSRQSCIQGLSPSSRISVDIDNIVYRRLSTLHPVVQHSANGSMSASILLFLHGLSSFRISICEDWLEGISICTGTPTASFGSPSFSAWIPLLSVRACKSRAHDRCEANHTACGSTQIT